MRLYSDLIKQEKEYNYSANIQFDIENDRKLARFIPNETTIELMREYFVDITLTEPSHHARMLCGSYGTGKSHFLTVLSLLLSKSFTTSSAYELLLTRIRQYDEALCNDIEKYINDNTRKPFLVVPIVFDFDDFERCIYFSLKRKLDSIGLKVSFKTFFDQARNLVEQWKSNPESKDRLARACKSQSITISKLERLLSVFDEKAEPIFQQVFSEMTFGVKYIYEVSNIAESIKQANEAIEDNYSGIVFIFDEFGRYIEDNIKTIKVKAVQDLAECCDHGYGNNHIILVTHKEIGQYTQRYGKAISNEWKKVEGRYKTTPINDHPDQCLSLIKNVLIRNTKVWESFKNKYSDNLENMYSEAAEFRGFLLDASNGENPFENGFPLHPISLFALDKLSKKVAQNERTFFTFLASKDENSLYSFLSKNSLNEFHYIGIDDIFNYFEPSIKSAQNDNGYQWYKNLLTAVSKNGSSLTDASPEVRILKVIATIGIINDSSSLISDKKTILRVIDCPKDILANALEELCERKIIKYSGAYNRYDFYEASIFDVESLIRDASQMVTYESVVNTLNEEFVDFVLYPNKYNRDYKIKRVFIPVFATSQELFKKSFTNKFGKYYDGILVFLLQDYDTSVESIIELSKELDRVIIFANKDIENLISFSKRYIAIKYLESQKATYISKDPAFEKELVYYKDELGMSVSNCISEWKTSFNDDTNIIYLGNLYNSIKSFSELSEIASLATYNAFPETLIVNNELINKNNISGSISAAKKNAITNIIQGCSSVNYFDLPFLSPDYIMVRSVLAKNGFISFDDIDVQCNKLANGTKPQEKVSKVIDNFINMCKRETLCFEQLINELRMPPFGLRSGYISLLIANAFISYKKSLIVSSHNVEQEISADLFEEIVKRPSDYDVTIAAWTKDQTDYLESLELIFSDYISEVSISRNRLKAIYDAMSMHYKSVSKFSRTTNTYVSENTKSYRTLIEKSSANYSTFIFTKLKGLFGDFETAIKYIKRIKDELDNAVYALSIDLSKQICDIFNAPNSQPLETLFRENYKNNWKAKRTKSFDYYTNSFLEFASNVERKTGDNEIIIGLSKVLTGFELVYWNDEHKNEFISRLKDVSRNLNSYDEKAELSDGETKLTLVDFKGAEQSVVFEMSELSGLTQTLKNKISSTFEHYGRSISYENKLQVLISLIEELIEGK